jgi:DnaJ-class molecular chaperone
MSLWISLLDVVSGGSRTVNVGTQTGNQTVEIEIPRGIEDGDNVQYGGIAPGGMDLVIQFRIQPDPRWRREGLNLFTDHKVSVWDLILGGQAEIRNLEGSGLVVTIPKNTQPMTTLRLRQQGIQNKTGQKGDLFVKLLAEIPKTIAPELVDAIQQYR